jgi:uncharacterized protein YmfQ (DUF2313 family)
MRTPYSALTSDDYLDAAKALLPHGRAWPRDETSTLSHYLNAVANVIFLAHRALTKLFETELDPTTADAMLPDWEAAYGITAKGNKDARRSHLATVIVDPGGFTGAHYVALATSLGYTATAVAKPVDTHPYEWELHVTTSPSTKDRATLESLILSQNRATCKVTFVYP